MKKVPRNRKPLASKKALKVEIVDSKNSELDSKYSESRSVQGKTVDAESPVEASLDSLVDSTQTQADADYEGEVTPALASESAPQHKSRSIGVVDPISVYMREVQKYPLLTREKELELAKKYYETKDPSAAQALVTANLRFVVKVAAEYSKFGARLIDLVQEGNLGLMHAVRDFNPYKGVRLITYAVWWIRGYIQEYLMKQYSMVKIGTTLNQKKLFYQLQRERESLEKLGQDEGIRLLSSKMGIPEDEVKVMTERMRGRDISLNQPVESGSSLSFQDLQRSVAPDMEEELVLTELIEILRSRIDEIRPLLNEKEKIILEERLLADEPLTLKEIGDKYGITREAVRQVEARLIGKIKEKMSEAT